MYWSTRFGDHTPSAAITTITVINAVSTTNHTDMPSTPRW